MLNRDAIADIQRNFVDSLKIDTNKGFASDDHKLKFDKTGYRIMDIK